MTKLQRIRDPIHNLIEFDGQFEQVCWQVVQTAPFQRLRRIKQLGFSEFVYPGAVHSRLAHSLGVFHTARQLLSVVERKQGEATNQRRSQAATAAALVHDLGHGPFSHAFEDVLKRLKLSRHEATSVRLIRETRIGEILNSFSPKFADEVAQIIGEKLPSDFYAAVVSSQFDADRLDYMRRDRMMTGTQSSAIDFDWLLANLEVRRVTAGQDDSMIQDVETLVVGPKATLAAEAYVLGLFHLYQTVYLHKTTRGVEKIFSELLMRVFTLARDGSGGNTGLPIGHPLLLYADDVDNLEIFQLLDDSVIWGAMPLLARAVDKCIAELADRLLRRELFKARDITAILKRKYPDSWEECRAAEAEIRERIKDSDLLSSGDSAPRLLDDLAKRDPYERQVESSAALKTIYAIDQSGQVDDLSRLSPVVEALKPYQAYRVYYRPQDDETRKRVDKIMEGV